MAPAPYVCARCMGSLRRSSLASTITLPTSRQLTRWSSSFASRASQPRSEQTESSDPSKTQAATPDQEPEQGALSRRLQEATEEALLTGGRSGQRAVLEESGFSEELKDRLLARVANAKFKSDNAAAFAAPGLDSPESNVVGQGSRDIASAAPWTGTESTEDAVLRMLTDARKPLSKELRGKPRIPEPNPVDMRIRRERKVSSGVRAASARDRASAYASLGLKGLEKEGKPLTEKEQEALKQEFRDRFTPAARAVPATLTGLAALANERIEDAIARGQFKNIPRGKGVERDTRADNPFIDTTEYIMNKMIKRQEIVPPWIEKQQELIKAANNFRARVRSDWRRHAARMISSAGGTLQEKMNRAVDYAKAEEVYNPRRRNVDQISVPTNATDDPVMVKLRQEVAAEEAASVEGQTAETATTATSANTASPSSEPEISFTRPFRDPAWEATERGYMELAINNLNAITRSYNLMAPELAKKPYFSLERELNNCFADVAPLLANEIKERASRPPPRNNATSEHKPSVLDRFSRETARIYERKMEPYGFKEMWRDLFSKSS
ncbi:hypothetical protein CONLIGDRAFT_504168 [Coniochaeta ligniaria NRRL 30616]|uniref:DnaJ homologue subfamily C member 28 conserved domain-containing protein n=1 Tax=Coniochaeta ligniaria NRRL 30616 TaxID=1408157 RepID=A0A1J7JDY0_9PEZI|nr:hypothetical protein CONLIGDRAFT_504168 [Coniochaeta ligniaria NRRL 30616]